MAISDEDFWRKYLDDPNPPVINTPVPYSIGTQVPDSSVSYYRKYLCDPS